MKKSSVVIIILVLIIVGLAGFIVWDKVLNKDKTQTEDTTTKNEVESTNTTNISNESRYAEEYIKVIDKIKVENPDSEIICDLIYFNNDNIPDLVVGINGYWVSLYMYENGEIYNPVDQWAYGTGSEKFYNYLEKCGVISGYGNEFAGFIAYKSLYILNSNHKLDSLTYVGAGAEIDTTNQEYDEVKQILERDSGYYYNDMKISEQEYNNKLKELSISTDENDYKFLEGTKTIDEIKKQLQ